MFTFLFILTKNKEESFKKKIQKSGNKILSLLNNDKLQLELDVNRINENADFYFIKPRISDRLLLHTFSNQEYFVILYGELNCFYSKSQAEYILNIYLENGINKVRKLDGIFSFLFFNKKNNNVIISSDFIGQRKLKYYKDKNLILVSSHDLNIIATGITSLEVNLNSVYSILAYGWSLNGESLIKKIETYQSDEILEIINYEINKISCPLITQKIKVNQNKSDEIISEIISYLKKIIRFYTKYKDNIIFDLTAGMDSRALLGLVLSEMDVQKIICHTLGNEKSPEVKTAVKITNKFSIKHQFGLPKFTDIKEFIEHLKLLAYSMNGDTDSCRAIHPINYYLQYDIPKFGAQGAAGHMGVYFPTKDINKLNSFSKNYLIDYLKEKNQIKNKYKIDKEIQNNLDEKIISTILKFSKNFEDNSNILNQFYFNERLRNWGSVLPNSSWNLREITPFLSPKIIYLQFKIPAEKILRYPIHKKIILRYSKHLYWYKINHNPFNRLPFFTNFNLLFSFFQFNQKIWYYFHVKFFKRIFKTTEINKSHNQKRAEIFAGELNDFLMILLKNKESIGSRIFNENYYDIFNSDKKIINNFNIISKLITIEFFLKLAREIQK